MEHVLIEELVNFREYDFTLNYELPLDSSMAARPELTVVVQDLRQLLRPDGLLVSGSLAEEIILNEGLNREKSRQSFHFTYLIPRADLKEANLLNFEITPSIEQVHYHLIKKEGQVFLKEQIQLKLQLAEYHLKEQYQLTLGGIEQQSGQFLQKTGQVEKSFLKIYPIELPQDFSLLKKLSGRAEVAELEVAEETVILDVSCRLQGEYVTDEKKLGAFFLEKKEHFFFSLSGGGKTPGQVRARIELVDLHLENEQEVAVLYRVNLQFFQKEETTYYTGSRERLPEGAITKNIVVEEIGPAVTVSQFFQEELNFTAVQPVEIVKVSGGCQNLQVEAVGAQVIVAGELELTAVFLDGNGLERVCQWSRPIDQMVQGNKFTLSEGDFWEAKVAVEIPVWEFTEGRLKVEGVADFAVIYHSQAVRPVLTEVPAEGRSVEREKFYLKEEIDTGCVTFQGEEEVYLHRYASQVLRLESQVTGWENRAIAGGWMVKGAVDLTVYYLAREGERHLSSTFRFYQYISDNRGTQAEISLLPEVQVLDHELLEDGSMIKIHYLGTLQYSLYKEAEVEVITSVCPGVPKERARCILSAGKVEQRLEKRIPLTEEWFSPSTRIRGLEDIELGLKDYQINLEGEELKLVGEIELQVKYQNILGKERFKVVPLHIEMTERITIKGEPCQQFRAVPLVKGYDYRLTGHPAKGELNLAISVELNYRLIGTLSCL